MLEIVSTVPGLESWGDYLNLANEASRVSLVLKKNNYGVQVVAYLDSIPVAASATTITFILSTTEGGVGIELSSLYVSSHARRKGVGGKVLAELLRLMKEFCLQNKGVAPTYAFAEAWQASRGVLSELGFEKLGGVQGAAPHTGGIQWMILRFPPPAA